MLMTTKVLFLSPGFTCHSIVLRFHTCGDPL